MFNTNSYSKNVILQAWLLWTEVIDGPDNNQKKVSQGGLKYVLYDEVASYVY